MSKPAVTYLERECKKALPVLVLAVLYVIFVFGNVYLRLADKNIQVLEAFAYSEGMALVEYGELFMTVLGETLVSIHSYVVILIELLLLGRVFYQENRAGVSDFLRILPIKERDKVLIKVGVGEGVIFGFSVLFGLAGTVANMALAPELEETTEFFSWMKESAADITVKTYTMIWQTALLMFLAMSAIFLVLFVARLCIHSMLVAMLVGVGILFTPFYYAMLYGELIDNYASHVYNIPSSLLKHFPVGATEALGEAYQMGGVDIEPAVVRWEYLNESIIFCLILILTALVILALTLHYRWNVRETNHVIINSPAVREFIMTGFAISFGTAWILCFGNNYWGTGSRINVFFIQSLMVGAVVWIVMHIIGFIIAKRQRAI